MTWLTWLVLAALVAAVAAITGAQPQGARPVARTRMMGAARLALVALALVMLYAAFRSQAGGS